MTAPPSPERPSRGTADGTLRLAFPARETAAMIRRTLYGATRHKTLGINDTPLPPLSRVIEEFCLRALSPPAEGQEKRREGGRS